MADKTMAKRQDAEHKSQRDHAGFKETIMDDIDAQKGETAQKKGQNGAMDRTGDGGADTQNILVQFYLHGMTGKDRLI